MNKNNRVRFAVIIGLIALAAAYVVGLRGRSPAPGDRPQSIADVTWSEFQFNLRSGIHHSYRQLFLRGEGRSEHLDGWLTALSAYADDPHWVTARIRVLLRHSRYADAIALGRSASHAEAEELAVLAEVILGQRPPGDLPGHPEQAIDQAEAPRFSGLGPALAEVEDARRSGNTADIDRALWLLARRAGEARKERPGLYVLVANTPIVPTRVDSALELARERLLARPDDPRAQIQVSDLLLLRALASLSLLDSEGVDALLDEAEVIGFELADVLYLRTMRHLVAGDWDAAMASAQRGHEHLSLLFAPVLASLEVRQGAFNDAVEHMREWRTRHDAAVQPEQLIGRAALDQALQIEALTQELARCREDAPPEPASHTGLLVAGDRFRCHHLGQPVAFRRWFRTAFELTQLRSDEWLAPVLLGAWPLAGSQGSLLVAARPDRFLGLRREMVRAHIGILTQPETAEARWQQIERLRDRVLGN